MVSVSEILHHVLYVVTVPSLYLRLQNPILSLWFTARLYLMAAVKQVMYNGLEVLAIEPLEQL